MKPSDIAVQRSIAPSLLTQCVGDARLHVVSADVTDTVLMLRLGQHHNSDIPEGVDGNLVGITTQSPLARAQCLTTGQEIPPPTLTPKMEDPICNP